MSGSRPVGVYWGRFNPPHRGHLDVIRRLTRRCHLVVAIGSAERENTTSDPFNGRERKAMMEAYLNEARVRGVRVLTLRDGPSTSWAIRNLLRRCRPDILYLSTEKNALIRTAQRWVKVVRFQRTGQVSSTMIRTLIARGDPSWRRFTGDSVARLIEENRGEERIQRAFLLRRGKASRVR